MAACTAHVPPPTMGTITVAISAATNGSILGAGHWGFGYYFKTGPLTALNFDITTRTETVILATLTVTVGDLEGLNSVLIDISGTMPNFVNAWIEDCALTLINLDTNQEKTFAGWPGPLNRIIPTPVCYDETQTGQGQPYGSWSFHNFDPESGSYSWIPLWVTNTTLYPGSAPPPPASGCVIGASMNPFAGDTVTGCIVSL